MEHTWCPHPATIPEHCPWAPKTPQLSGVAPSSRAQRGQSYLAVDEGDGGAELEEDEAHRLAVHAAGLRVQQLEQVAGQELHDDEEAVADGERVAAAHDVRVREAAQHVHLAPRRALDLLRVGVVVADLRRERGAGSAG